MRDDFDHVLGKHGGHIRPGPKLGPDPKDSSLLIDTDYLVIWAWSEIIAEQALGEVTFERYVRVGIVNRPYAAAVQRVDDGPAHSRNRLGFEDHSPWVAVVGIGRLAMHYGIQAERDDAVVGARSAPWGARTAATITNGIISSSGNPNPAYILLH
ncbi:hypothetical protein OLZ32_08130 [Rhizobium sp. 1AS11]|uniref:hypothetical protein n=1 Tax=Rhizobium acaciae TaxID=2989736 RepID=UPI0022215146|nr:hypothetical protein [Rhizobium acaciae]MCW1408227.1 hypothetical protein [Rhizobium acaciae]MCW1740378.1 hypothetical protein [Rhizobium acaciae]